jgi:hypothetical protein
MIICKRNAINWSSGFYTLKITLKNDDTRDPALYWTQLFVVRIANFFLKKPDKHFAKTETFSCRPLKAEVTVRSKSNHYGI